MSKASRRGRPPVSVVLEQHVQEAAILRGIRAGLVRAPHVALDRLQRIDDRIDAHLDGLAVAGDDAVAPLTAALERAGTGEVFAFTSLAHGLEDRVQLERLLSIAVASEPARRGFVSGLAWSAPSTDLASWVQRCLDDANPTVRAMGHTVTRISAVADNGPRGEDIRRVADPVEAVQTLWRAGASNAVERVDDVLSRLADAEPEIAAHAAAAACMLGERHDSVAALSNAVLRAGPMCERFLPLALMSGTVEMGRRLLTRLTESEPSQNPSVVRSVIRGCGWLGDSFAVPWLIGKMHDPTLARIAGESFSWITGADLARLDLEDDEPKVGSSPVTDEVDDDTVELYADDDLAWPAPLLVDRWWSEHSERFRPGTASLLGGAPTTERCLHVLATGTQRVRAVAAMRLKLLHPRAPLANVFAPARAQLRLMDAQTGRRTIDT